MSKKLYALLTGINDYPPHINVLHGCVNDVNHLHGYLKDNFKSNLLIERLINSDATRTNIIELFKKHLCKAGENDVVLFHYSGHGATEMSAPEFKEFYPDGVDETLVCYDSRCKGGYDLADKELAALLAEVARKNPHIAVILDCCHSGSGTREADDFKLAAVRQAPGWEPGRPRPIETYIGGYKDMAAISIPKSKHVLMAACDRTQKAWETNLHCGVFTSTLLEVLEKSKGNISYADLFVMCRSAVLKRAQNQTPQFETFNLFLPYSKFLAGELLTPSARHHVFYNDGWKIDCGALHGLPSDAEKRIEVALYPFGHQGPSQMGFNKKSPGDSKEGEIAGYTEVLKVGAQESTLIEDSLTLKSANKDTHYKAEILSLPVPPMPVLLEGDDKNKKRVRDSLALDKSLNFDFPTEPSALKYVLSVENEQFLLKNRETGLLIQGAKGDPETCITYIFSVLEDLSRWQRRLALGNPHTELNTGLVDFRLLEILDNGEMYEYKDNEITLDYVKEGEHWKNIKIKPRTRNRTNNELHFALCYFSEEYGIHILKNDPIAPGENWVTLWGDQVEEYIDLPNEANEGTDIFKLFVSTEKVENYLLEQEDLEIGKIIDFSISGGTRRAKRDDKKITNDWFTKTITVKVVRQLTRVSEEETSLANGRIKIKGHPSFKANMSLTGDRSHTRGLEHNTMDNVFTGEGFEPLSFSSSRGQGGSVLEFTDISNAGSLKNNPLEIVLDTKLKEDEYLLPITFDGNHFLPIGNPIIEENGDVAIGIDHIPEITDKKRRSLGKALKLCFYKLIPGRKNIDKLKRYSLLSPFFYASSVTVVTNHIDDDHYRQD